MLLGHNNTDFSDSVMRGALHHKSGPLKKLLTALTAFQNQSSRINLIDLNKALLNWFKTNPAEFRSRKQLVSQLRGELQQQWLAMGNPWLTAAGSTEFERSVSRGAMHSKSRRLRSLIAALAQLQSGNGTAQEVYDSLFDWKSHNPDEFKNRGWLVDFLVAELKYLGARAGAPPAPPTAVGNTTQWVEAKRADLDRCKTLGCGDATRFNGMINAGKRTEILRREGQTRTGRGDQAGGIGAVSKAWNPGALRNTYDGILGDGGGVCTTFGHYCAHVLSHGRPLTQRIEVVAYRNHVFLIVGRVGGYNMPGHRILDRATWGPSYCIVDGWLGAMGYEVIYPQGCGYPYPGMLSPLKLVMASDIQAGDQLAVADVGLRSREGNVDIYS